MVDARTRDAMASLMLRMTLLELFVGIPLPLISVVVLGIGDPRVVLGLAALRPALMLVYLWQLGEPIRRWGRQGPELGDGQVVEVEDALQRLAPRYCVVHVLAWMVAAGLPLVLDWAGIPDQSRHAAIDRVLAFVLQCSAIIGSVVVLMPTLRAWLVPVLRGVGAELVRRKLSSRAPLARMGTAMLVMHGGAVMSVFLGVAAINGIIQLGEARERSLVELAEEAEIAALHVRAGEPLAEAALMGADELPSPLDVETGVLSSLDIPMHELVAAAPVGDGRWTVVRMPLHDDIGGFALSLAILSPFVVFTLAVQSFAIPRMFMQPLAQLGALTRRVIEVGDLGEIGRIAPLARDEIGDLVRDFNGMLDMLDELAEAASTVAAGDLRVELGRPGELHDAFRGMLRRLHEMVVRIRSTSLELASAAAEIHAITQEQEAAAEQQSTSVREVSATVASLASSAESISSTAKEVLDNADQTLVTTAAMLSRIGELSNQANGIGDLLERIREIADRSDLLALNGSLEATRVGEAGRGFALVAAEMRRLAERVTATVADVRERVGEVKATGTGTVMAAEDSRKLAELTATAARQISLVTGRQSQDTEQVASTVQAVASVVIGSATSTSQTRSAAEGLKSQAEALEQLTRQFQLRRASAREEERVDV